jgi:hypothetical protein
LIPQNVISDTAVKSGNWSDPATWGGRLPGNDDNAWIPNGVTVTVDRQEPGALRSILDNGVLQFATNVNTSLLVDTIVVGTDDASGTPHGELDIGTLANPIQPGVRAVLTFADTGTLTQAWSNDPAQLARGLISMNTVSIVGATVTPYEQVLAGMGAGSTTVTLAAPPTGWHVGDTLLFPGASPTAAQDEQIGIRAINGNVVTLATPLAYSHAGLAGEPVYVADEARNVVLQSQNTSDYERFGHVMFMHSDQEVVENAAFLHLGRTDKALPLGATNPDGTKNIVGRYALHFHRDYWPTLSQNDPPILVSGNFEMGSPGWGYDNHSSNVDMEDNVAFQNNGAAFVTEAGNEIGTFNANLAVRTTGVADGTDFSINESRRNINDFGFTGSGFWMQSPSCALTNNIALDDTTGFQFDNQSLTQSGINLAPYQNAPQITTWSGQNTQTIPVSRFTGNTAANSVDGIELFWNLTVNVPQAPGAQSIIDHFTAWNVTVGADVGTWSSGFALQNSQLVATPGSVGFGVRSDLGGYDGSATLTNDIVTGFAIGDRSPSRGISTFTGGVWDDTIAFEISQQAALLSANRHLSYSGVSFGPHVQTQYQWDSQQSLESDDPNSDFVPQQVYIDGVEAYFANQGASNVPFSSSDQNVPVTLYGLTNSQLLQHFGLAMEGELQGQQNAPFWYKLNPNVSQPISKSASYTLSYYTPEGIVTEALPLTLQPGWNLITRIVDGAPHSWLVGFNAPTSPPAPQDGVSSYQIVAGLATALSTTTTITSSAVDVTATSSASATAESIMVTHAGIVWSVTVGGNGLYIEKNGTIVRTLLIPASGTYSFDVKLGTSVSVVVNGIEYL